MADLMISENHRLVREDIISQTNGYNTSARYIPIATREVLEIIGQKAEDYKIIGFNNTNVRKKDKDGFQKHAVMVEFPNAEMIDGTKMNMILFNSNDRSTSLKIFMGSLRAACSNQCVWGDQIAEPISIRHTNKEWKHSIYSLMDEYEEVQRQTEEMINRMMNRYMSYGDMGRFAERVADEVINPVITGELVDPLELLVSRRPEDHHKDLWRTFNKAQEYTLHGGLTRLVKKEDDEGHLFDTYSKTHVIKDTKKQIDINRQLHSLAMEYL
jgi:hypothetical protein